MRKFKFNTTKRVQTIKTSIHYQGGEKTYNANCPICGALLYSTKAGLSTFQSVFDGEISYCYHCSQKVTAKKIELDEEKYCCSIK